MLKLLHFLKALISIILITVLPAQGQLPFKGKVIDETNSEPLPYTNIFLNNTTYGTTTLEDGTFSMEIPSGEHEIVVKYIGYELVSFKINTEELAKGYVIKLAPEPVELNSITIESTRDKNWYANLQIFKTYFLGTSKNALACEILNPKDLIIDSENTTRTLKVSARKAIKITNPNLGYEIDYLLENFIFDRTQNKIFFSGYPLFKPLDLRKGKERRVIKERKEAYHGSFMHFLRVIANDSLEASGFIVKKLKREPSPDRPDEALLLAAKREFTKSTDQAEKDSLLNNYISKSRLPKYVDYLVDKELLIDEFTETDEEGNFKLKFDNLLYIVYTKEKEALRYVGVKLNRQPTSQTTILHLLNEEAGIDKRGILLKPNSVFLEGYMGWEKIGELLPINYKP
ncbi:MAG: carboxypeptidase-like regulatory domain-containing protein [Fulvivirga sp.]